MLLFLVLLSFVGLLNGQLRNDPLAQPTPYSFSYESPAIGGFSRQRETGDGQGRVEGEYEIGDEDGRSRLVQYVADEGGFRASISTNEPGTSNQDPADVDIVSSAEDAPGPVQPVPIRTSIPRRRNFFPAPITFEVVPEPDILPEDDHFHFDVHPNPNIFFFRQPLRTGNLGRRFFLRPIRR